METLNLLLPYIQIVLSVLLVGGILLQRSDASLGGAFGGGDGPTTQFTRRGAEKKLFNMTIAMAVLFAFSNILSFLL